MIKEVLLVTKDSISSRISTLFYIVADHQSKAELCFMLQCANYNNSKKDLSPKQSVRADRNTLTVCFHWREAVRHQRLNAAGKTLWLGLSSVSPVWLLSGWGVTQDSPGLSRTVLQHLFMKSFSLSTNQFKLVVYCVKLNYSIKVSASKDFSQV